MPCVFEGVARRVEVRGVGSANLVRAQAFAEGLAASVELSTARVGSVHGPVTLVAPASPAELDPIDMGPPSGTYEAEYTVGEAGLTIRISAGAERTGRFRGKLAGAPACVRDEGCEVQWTNNKNIVLVVKPDEARIAKGSPLRFTGKFPFSVPTSGELLPDSLNYLALDHAIGTLTCGEARPVKGERLVWALGKDTTARVDEGLFLAPDGIRATIVSSDAPSATRPLASFSTLIAGVFVVALVMFALVFAWWRRSRRQPEPAKPAPAATPPPLETNAPLAPGAASTAVERPAQGVAAPAVERPVQSAAAPAVERPAPAAAAPAGAGLNGERREALAKALLAAFPSRDSLEEMLAYKLDKNLDEYAGDAGLRAVVLALIKAASAEGWLRELVAGAHRHVPANPPLRAFHDEFFALTDVRRPAPVLEALVNRSAGFLDLKTWIAKAAAIEAQVCQIEVDDVAVGTGFLIGPDLVLTNYHVIEPAAKGPSQRVRLRFDVTEPGRAGTVHELAAAWLVDSSPYSAVDLDPSAASEPADDELDYAVLRAATEVGRESVGGRERGWQRRSPARTTAAAGAALIIVQHPNGEHLQFALDTQAVVRAGPTRVRYRTNTLPGSSGSPCFDLRWNLIALHHSGDRSFRPVWNEGVPIDAVWRLLDRRGVA